MAARPCQRMAPSCRGWRLPIALNEGLLCNRPNLETNMGRYWCQDTACHRAFETANVNGPISDRSSVARATEDCEAAAREQPARAYPEQPRLPEMVCRPERANP